MAAVCVNAVTGSFSGVEYDGNGNLRSTLGQFDTLCVGIGPDGHPLVPEFYEITRFSFLAGGDDGSILDRKGKLRCVIRLSRTDGADGFMGIDLDSFVIDLEGLSGTVCRMGPEYMNYTRITRVSGLDMSPGFGEYAFKVLTGEEPEDGGAADLSIQCMSKFSVERKYG